MYVWARLARVAATSKGRGDYRFGDESRLSFRCLPIDIDFNMHLNNARYMMLADLGRMDIFFRAGVVRAAREHGWSPMLGGVQATFVREIKLWRRFDIVSSLETWEGTQIVGRHRFVLDTGETAAMVMTTAGVYQRKMRRFLEIDEVAAALGQQVTPRPPTEAERIFVASHNGLRALAKTAG